MLRYTLQRKERSALRNLLVSSSSEIFSLFLPGSGLSWGRGWIQHWKNLMLLIWVRASFESDIKKSLLDSYSQQLEDSHRPFFGNSSISFRSQSLCPVSSPSLCDQSRDEREVWLSPDWKALSAVSNTSSSSRAPCCPHLSLQLIYEL